MAVQTLVSKSNNKFLWNAWKK